MANAPGERIRSTLKTLRGMVIVKNQERSEYLWTFWHSVCSFIEWKCLKKLFSLSSQHVTFQIVFTFTSVFVLRAFVMKVRILFVHLIEILQCFVTEWSTYREAARSCHHNVSFIRLICTSLSNNKVYSYNIWHTRRWGFFIYVDFFTMI